MFIFQKKIVPPAGRGPTPQSQIVKPGYFKDESERNKGIKERKGKKRGGKCC